MFSCVLVFSINIKKAEQVILLRRSACTNLCFCTICRRLRLPSRIFRVLLISFGITILPKSSTLLTMPVAFIFLSPFTILDGATENRVIARALAPVAIRIPCRQRRRGALHRKKTDSHDQFANWSRNDRGGCPHPPENISDYNYFIAGFTFCFSCDMIIEKEVTLCFLVSK